MSERLIPQSYITDIENWLIENSLIKLYGEQIERYLWKNDLNIERTKDSIRNNFEYRCKHSAFFTQRDVDIQHLEVASRNVLCCKLNGLSKEGCNVMLISYLSTDATEYNFIHVAKLIIMTIEMILHNDLNPFSEYILLLDRSKFRFSHMRKMQNNALEDFYSYFDIAFSGRMKMKILINTGWSTRLVVIFSRFFGQSKFIHEFDIYGPGNKEYFRLIPEEMIPVELGGTGKKITDLHDDVIRQLKQHGEKFKNEDEILKQLIENGISVENLKA